MAVNKQNMTAAAFKARCLSLLDEVDQQRKEILITKHGRPVERLVPVHRKASAIFGGLTGSGRIVGDIFSTERWDADCGRGRSA